MATTATTNGKPLTFHKWLEKHDISRLRRMYGDAAAIKQTDPRRKAARELVLSELEDIALLYLTDAERENRMQAARDDMKQTKAKEECEQFKARYDKAEVKNGEGLLRFFGENIGPVWALNNAGQNNGMTGGPLCQWIDSGNPIAAGCNPDMVILCVRDDAADKLAKTHDLPKTLQWSAEGFTCWAFAQSSGRMLYPVAGEGVRLVSHFAQTEEPVYAPLTGRKWLVPPDKAVADGVVGLPTIPTSLAETLEAVAGAKGAVVDKIIL
jgi:hypothetical protein